MGKRKKWLLVLAAVLALGLGYVVYSLFFHSAADYLTVSELKSQVTSLRDQQVRVEGKVASGSVSWDDKANVTRFLLTDNRENVAIVYEGMVPDSFKPGANLIVAGRYRPDGIFEALSFGSRRSICSLCH